MGMRRVSILHVCPIIREKEREFLTWVHAKIQNSETKTDEFNRIKQRLLPKSDCNALI